MTPWSIQSLDSPGKNTGVGSFSLLQEIFPTQGSNTGLPHCRWILYQLNPKGSPRILEWVNYPSSHPGDLPKPGIKPGSPALQADCLPTEVSGKTITEKGMKTEYRNQLSRKQIHDQENQQSPLVILLKRTLTPIIF